MDAETKSIVCLESLVLIDFIRKQNKRKSFFFQLGNTGVGFAVPVMVHYKIYSASLPVLQQFWDNIFSDFFILNHHVAINYTGIRSKNILKKKRKSISLPDLIIAATALHYDHPLVTLDTKDFIHINGQQLIHPII